MIENPRLQVLNSFSDNRKSQIQNRKWVGIVIVVVTFAMCGEVAMAQQRTKIPRIGYLAVVPLSTLTQRTEAFRQGLRDLGYAEGKNILIEWRSDERNPDRMPTLAAELVQLKVDVFVTAGSTATGSAKADQPSPTRR